MNEGRRSCVAESESDALKPKKAWSTPKVVVGEIDDIEAATLLGGEIVVLLS